MRLRFAPSPTGQLHVGNARTALFNWLLARGAGGTFILRIEDTDVERSTQRVGARPSSRTCAGWASTGRGRRRRRRARTVSPVRAAAHLSRPRGGADVARARPTTASVRRSSSKPIARPRSPAGRRRSTSAAAATSRATRRGAASRTARRPVIRFRVPEATATSSSTTSCAARCVSAPRSSAIRCCVRSDGVPAYNYAVVIDDALMGITHVIRGEDHISNTPRQMLLYEAFGWTAAGVRARVAGDGARSQPAVEAPRRDVGGRVPRPRLPAGGADQLPGAHRLVAGRGRGAAAARRAGARGSGSRTSATAPACSTSRSWRGSIATT